MKKRVLKEVLSLALVSMISFLTFPEIARAESEFWAKYSGGKSIETNFKDQESFDEVFRNMQPGESRELTVSISSTVDSRWWIENQVIYSSEDIGQSEGAHTEQNADEGRTASGGYEYELYYYPDANNMSEDSRVNLLDKERVGGDNTTSGVGLHQATVSLEDFTEFEDSLKPGETGLISLKITVDGETQGNAYQDTAFAVRLRFAAETNTTTTVTPGASRTTTTTGSTTRSGSVTATTPAKTSDDSHMLRYAVIAGISALVLLILGIATVRYRKNNLKDKEE